MQTCDDLNWLPYSSSSNSTSASKNSFSKLRSLTHRLFSLAYNQDPLSLSDDHQALSTLRSEIEKEISSLESENASFSNKKMFASSPVAGVILDGCYNLTAWNEKFYELVQLNGSYRQRLLERGIDALFHESDLQMIKQSIQNIRANRLTRAKFDCLMRRSCESLFQCQLTMIPWLDKSSETKIICFVEDLGNERFAKLITTMFGGNLFELSRPSYFESILRICDGIDFIHHSALLLCDASGYLQGDFYHLDTRLQVARQKFQSKNGELISDRSHIDFSSQFIQQLEKDFRCLYKNSFRSIGSRLQIYPILSRFDNRILGLILAEVDSYSFKQCQFDKIFLELTRPISNQAHLEPYSENIYGCESSALKKLDVKDLAMEMKQSQSEKNRFLREIDARKRAEINLLVEKSRAEKASQTKTQFLANMSHEVRTPLTGIIGILSLLREMPASTKQKQYFEMMDQSSQVLLRLVNEILDLSRIEMGQTNLQIEKFNFRNTIRQLLSMHLMTAEKKNIDLMISYPHNQPNLVETDEIRVRQVIDNLVSNAIKFTDRGGVYLFVRFRRGNQQNPNRGFLEVSVKDTGCGISKKDLEKIWRQFERLDNSPTRTSEGFGLGLYITKKLIGILKGRVHVNARLGMGSEFLVRIPVSFSTGFQEKKFFSIRQKFRVFILSVCESSYHILKQIMASSGLSVKRISQLPSVSTVSRQDIIVMDYQALTSLKKDILYNDYFLNRSYHPCRFFVALSHESLVSDIPAGVRSFDPGLVASKQNLFFNAFEVLDEKKSRSESKLDGLRVLLAEDNAISLSVGVDMLRAAGAIVTSVVNGRQALEKARRSVFDLILMDCFMPEMDGVSAMEAIRSSLNSPPPIIAVTANAVAGAAKQYLNEGFDGYLAKPFTMRDLHNLIDDLIIKENISQSVS